LSWTGFAWCDTGRGARDRGAFAVDLWDHWRELADAGRGQHHAADDLCEKTRAEAFDLMLQHAADIGGNAVVGARYDATEVMQGVTEVLAYGTAVLWKRHRGSKLAVSFLSSVVSSQFSVVVITR